MTEPTGWPPSALTPEPTDADILDAADDFRSQYKHGGTTFDEFDALGFARAVLAKWATQPAVAWRYRPSAVWDDYVLTGDTGKAARARAIGLHVEALCLTTPQPTQAQAGAVPLTDSELVRRSRVGAIQTDDSGKVVMWPAYYRSQMEVRFKFGWREAERHHGIKEGGQHAE